MKKLIVSFSLLAFVFSIQGQKPVKLSDITMINLGDGRLYATVAGKKDKPINGKQRIITGFTTEYIDAEFAKGYAIGKWEYYKNNVLAGVKHYAEGLMHGEAIDYHTDGKTVKTKGLYKSGQKEGVWESFKRDGTTHDGPTEVYENGRLIKRVSYYTDNSISTETYFNADGQKHGTEKEYAYDGGHLVREQQYVNGKLVGKQMRRISSNLGSYFEYAVYNEAGQKDGEYTELWEDSKMMKAQGQYVKDKKHGKWLYGYADGEVPFEEEVYEDGIRKSKKSYTTRFDPAENYFELSNYNDRGQLDGEYLETWEKTSQTKTKGQYEQGRKHGTWTTYDINGKPLEETVYEKGHRVSQKKFDP
jgi:antitoxin component YwqK of YwqJK toxin-antitoxin module